VLLVAQEQEQHNMPGVNPQFLAQVLQQYGAPQQQQQQPTQQMQPMFGPTMHSQVPMPMQGQQMPSATPWQQPQGLQNNLSNGFSGLFSKGNSYVNNQGDLVQNGQVIPG
jgi:hypothetical protein